jgi:hypothetical protein
VLKASAAPALLLRATGGGPVAVESRIDADEEWFVGEDRVLRFVFDAGSDTSTIGDWSIVFELFGRRAGALAAPLLSVAATGVAGVSDPAAPAYAEATVPGEETAVLGPGIFRFVLRRTDVGFSQVLSFGVAQLRSAVQP